MEYVIIGFISTAVTYFLLKKAHNREIKKLDLIIESYDEKLSEKSEMLNMQLKILDYISDSLHNLGNDFFKENSSIEIKNEDFMKKIGIFFIQTRVLSRNIQKDIQCGSKFHNVILDHYYSKEDYEKIIQYIENDLHDFCHYKSNELDSEKFWTLIRER